MSVHLTSNISTNGFHLSISRISGKLRVQAFDLESSICSIPQSNVDLVPRCDVTRMVCFAFSVPIQNRSASESAVILVCLSVETNILLAGTSSISVSTIETCE
eukprot:scaffold78787_cov52-Attheya_sp.AAC.1